MIRPIFLLHCGQRQNWIDCHTAQKNNGPIRRMERGCLDPIDQPAKGRSTTHDPHHKIPRPVRFFIYFFPQRLLVTSRNRRFTDYHFFCLIVATCLMLYCKKIKIFGMLSLLCQFAKFFFSIFSHQQNDQNQARQYQIKRMKTCSVGRPRPKAAAKPEVYSLRAR